jgi:cytochrome c553
MRGRVIHTLSAVGSALLAGLAFAVQSDELREALERKPDYEHGRTLYEACAACHQSDGAGAAGGDIPNIAGQHFAVVINQLVNFRHTRRLDLRMNAFAASHRLEGPQELADVAAYISNLSPQQTDSRGDGRFTGVGAKAYMRACESCHGAGAEGNDRLLHPRLAGQHFGYLVKRMDMMIRGPRFNMSLDHSELLDSLTDEEIVGVADYLTRLRPEPRSLVN